MSLLSLRNNVMVSKDTQGSFLVIIKPVISYSKISRWLNEPIDPITVEDWLANREVFGPSKEKDLEEALKFELAENGQQGFFKVDETLLVAFKTAREAWIYGEKVEKINLPKDGLLKKVVDPKKKLKIKVAGKEWIGDGIGRILFDL